MLDSRNLDSLFKYNDDPDQQSDFYIKDSARSMGGAVGKKKKVVFMHTINEEQSEYQNLHN